MAELEADRCSRLRDDEERVLTGLRRELKQVGTGSRWWPPNWRWWPSNWRRPSGLEERIAELPVVARLQADAAQAVTVLAAVTGQQAEVQEAWAASHRGMVGRGVAAALQLQLREEQLLAKYLRDPPRHLLEEIGPPPSDAAGRQAWRDRARQVERGRTTDADVVEALVRSIGRGGKGLPDGPPERAEVGLRLRDGLGHNDLDATVRGDGLELDQGP